MAPKAKKIERGSQATPFAEQLLALLGGQMGMGGMQQREGALNAGAFGTGVGPLQQEAGTAIRQFVEGGGMPFKLSPLVGRMQDIFARQTEAGAAGIREGMGGMGLRFSTPLAAEEGKFRREAGTDFMATLGNIFREEHQRNIQNLMGGMGMMQQFGQQNIAPFMQLGQMGILPEEIMMQKNPLMQGLDIAAGIGQMIPGIGTAIGAGKGILDMFTGGGGGFDWTGQTSGFTPG